MKARRYLNLTVLVLLSLALTFPFASNHAVATQQQQPSHNPSSKNKGEQAAQTLKAFKPGREMLQRKGVPFDPDTLLDPDWKEKLGPVFDQMPEQIGRASCRERV